MRTCVLDASAVLRFTDREPGFDRVRELLEQAARGEIRLMMSAVNWGEIVYAVSKRNPAQAPFVLDGLAALPITIVPADASAAADAGLFKWRYGIPYADAFAGALTLRQRTAESKAVLVTADNDFRDIPRGVLSIEFLPGK